MSDVDAILVASFGGPEGPDDVMPFLRNVTRGRNVPEERLRVVAGQYAAHGGKSPINDQNRELIDALRTELDARGIDLPIYWGNRNWHPFLTDALQEMAQDGRRHAIAFVTSAYSSYSSCRQYREDIERARAEVGGTAPEIDKIRQFYNHPGFVDPLRDNLRSALTQLPDVTRDGAHIAFTAHSIPMSMSSTSRYHSQLLEAARLVVDGLGNENELVFQSRSGSPHVPWLEPDINDHLHTLRDKGVDAVVVAPIGFVSDHMEVIYDLDTIAAGTAHDLGLKMVRARTPGTDPRFVAMVAELIEERLHGVVPRCLGNDGVIGCLGKDCCRVLATGSLLPQG